MTIASSEIFFSIFLPLHFVTSCNVVRLEKEQNSKYSNFLQKVGKTMSVEIQRIGRRGNQFLNSAP
jgi:hypothetical protein